MSLDEILSFLIPQDEFQWIFLAIIVILSGWNIYRVIKDAKLDNWEKKWAGHASDSLDADHGSLSDLSQAVATQHEKLAEIMPGLLLIIGLLGTFLGLGIALNKASIILQQAQGSGMDQAMENLMGMMQGLGTKFKTSTWGIIGFLSFKAWSTKNGYEERRLRWCIQKIKKQLDSDRKSRLKTEQDRDLLIVGAINSLSTSFVDEIAKNRIELINSNVAVLELVKHAQTQTDEAQMLGRNILGMQSSIESMSNASNKIVEAADQMGASATDLKEVIGGFKNEIKDVLDGLEKNLAITISKMSQNLTDATNGISIAVNAMSHQVKETMGQISAESSKSTQIQQNSYATFETTSQSLAAMVEEMTALVNKLKDDIMSGLDAVSDKRQQTVATMKSIEKAFGIIENASKDMAKAAIAIEKCSVDNSKLSQNKEKVVVRQPLVDKDKLNKRKDGL